MCDLGAISEVVGARAERACHTKRLEAIRGQQAARRGRARSGWGSPMMLRVAVTMSKALSGEAGALLQVNPDVLGCAERSASFVDLILKGANPRDLKSSATANLMSCSISGGRENSE